MRYCIRALTSYFDVGKKNVCFARDTECYETCIHGLADRACPCCSSGMFSRVTVFSLCDQLCFPKPALASICARIKRAVTSGMVSVLLQTGCWVLLLSSVTARCPLSPDQDKFFAAQMHKQFWKLNRIFAIRNSRWCQTLLHTDFLAPVLIFRSSIWKICISFAMVVTSPLSTESTWSKGFTLSSQGQCHVRDWQLGKVEY